MALVHFLGLRTYSTELRRDLEQLEKQFNDLVLRTAPLFGNEPSSSFTSTTVNVIELPASGFDDPSNPVILEHTPGVSKKAMRADGAPKLSQAISPTMTGIWNYTPSQGTAPAVTVNAISGQTADMQVWNPLSNEDTVVASSGDVGVGEPVPTAMVSIKQRVAPSPTEADILALSPYAWWKAGDVDGNGTNNSAYADLDAVAIWKDKSGNGHHLSKSVDIGSNTLHKSVSTGGSSLTAGPNGEAWIRTLGWDRFAAWPGTAFGDAAAWTYCSVASISEYTLKEGTLNLSTKLALGGLTNTHYYSGSNGIIGATIFSRDFGSPTAWAGTGSGSVYSHCHRYDGAHTAFCQNNPLTTDTGGISVTVGAGAVSRSSWGRLHVTGDNTEGHPPSGTVDIEIILFQTALTPDQQALVHEYFASQYDASYAPSTGAGPLQDWKLEDGTVDSIVDEDLNWGIGISAPEAKLNVVASTNQLRLGTSSTVYTNFKHLTGTGISYRLPTSNAIGLLHNSTPSSNASDWSWSLVSLTADVTGTLPVANGGTGATTLTGILQGNGTSAVTAITNSTTVGQVLRVTASNTYAWGALDLADSDAITNDLPYSNLTPSGAASKLLGRGSASGAGDWQEITLGTNLTMSGTTLDASGSGGGGGSPLVVTTEDFEIATVLLNTTLSGTQASFTVTGLNSEDYDYIEIELHAQSNVAADSDAVNIAFNSDTTDGNYRVAYRYSGGTPIEGQADQRFIGEIPGDNSTSADSFGAMRIVIPKPSSAKRKMFTSYLAYRTTDAKTYVVTMGSEWENTAEINTITLTPRSGTNFVAGSFCLIKGFKERTVVTDATGGTHNLLDGSIHPDTIAGTVTKGDLIVGNDDGPDMWERFPVGANTYVVTADSTKSQGVKWAPPSDPVARHTLCGGI